MPAAQHNLTTANIITRGSAVAPLDNTGGKDRGKMGVPTSCLYYHSFGGPTIGAANSIALSQTVTVATTPLVVLNGALAAGGIATQDVARNVVAAWTGTSVITITGKDVHGRTVVEASASGTSLTGKKAFKTISSASFSADVTAATVGHGDVLGLPYACGNGDMLLGKFGLNTADAGTFVAAVTSAATATTGDVRGTYDPAGTLDGSTEVQVLLNISDTSNNGYGVAQFAG